MNVVPVKIRNGLYIVIGCGAGTDYKGNSYTYRKVFTKERTKYPLRCATYAEALALASSIALNERVNEDYKSHCGFLASTSVWANKKYVTYSWVWLTVKEYTDKLAAYKATVIGGAK